MFNEEGVFSLVRHDVDGTGLIMDVQAMTRRDAFLLRYDSENDVVQTAMCADQATDSPSNSVCLISTTATWRFCNCFGYAFENDEQLWREFAAGDQPPDVSFDDQEGDGATATGTDGGGPSDNTLITLSEIPEISDTYQFRPLPMGIFGSDGTSSQYIFQRKAPQLWDMVECDPCN